MGRYEKEVKEMDRKYDELVREFENVLRACFDMWEGKFK